MGAVPSINRLVHYVSWGTPPRADGSQAFTSKCRAAVITEVDPDDVGLVGLAVINPDGLFFHPLSKGGCDQDEHEHRGGTWHWAEMVPDPQAMPADRPLPTTADTTVVEDRPGG